VTPGNSLANTVGQNMLGRVTEQKPKKILVVDDESDVTELVS